MKYFFRMCELSILLVGLYMYCQEGASKEFFFTSGFLVSWGIDKLSDSIRDEIILMNREKM